MGTVNKTKGASLLGGSMAGMQRPLLNMQALQGMGDTMPPPGSGPSPFTMMGQGNNPVLQMANMGMTQYGGPMMNMQVAGAQPTQPAPNIAQLAQQRATAGAAPMVAKVGVLRNDERGMRASAEWNNGKPVSYNETPNWENFYDAATGALVYRKARDKGGIGGFIQDAGNVIGKGLGIASNFLPPGLSHLAGGVGSVLQGNNMQGHLAAVTGAKGGMGGLGSAIQGIAGGDLNSILKGIGGNVGGLDLNSLLGGLGGNIQGMLGGGIGDLGKLLGGGMGDLGSLLGGGASNIGQLLGGGANNLGQLLGGGASNIGQLLGGGTQNLAQLLGGGASNIGQLLGGGAQNIGGLLGAGAQNIGDVFGQGIGSLGGMLGNFSGGLGNQLGGFSQQIGGQLGNFAGDLYGGLGSLLGGAQSGIGNQLGSFGNNLTNQLGNFQSDLMGGLGSMLGGSMSGVGAAMGGIGSMLGSAQNAFGNATTGIGSMLGNFGQDLGKQLGGLTGKLDQVMNAQQQVANKPGLLGQLGDLIKGKDGSFDLTDLLKVGGAAGGLGLLLSGKMGDMLDPKLINTPRDNATNSLAALLQKGVGGQNIGNQLAQGFQMPGYTGSFGQGVTGGQADVLGQMQGLLAKQLNGGTPTDSAISALSGMMGNGGGMGPEQMLAMLQNPQGQQALQGIANGQNPLQQQMMGMVGQQNPAMAALMQQAGFQPGQLQGLNNFQSNANANPQIAALMQNAGQNPAALQALMGFNPSFQMGGDADAMRQLTGQGPQGLQQLLGMGNFGLDERGQLAQMANVQTPERQLLLQAIQGNPLGGAQQGLDAQNQAVQQLLGSGAMQNLLGGGGADPNAIYSALDAQRRTGLGRDVRDLREQFSFAGLRDSTDLQGAVAQRQAESEQGLMAQMAQIMPQLQAQQAQAQAAGLGAGGALAGMLGQGGQAAGQLGLQQQQNVLSALQGAGQLGLSGAQLGQQALGQAGQLGLGAGQLQQQALQAAMQGSLGARGQNADILGQLAGLNMQGQQAQSSQQLQALQAALQGQLGAQQNAAGALGQAGQLNLQGQQGNMQAQLQALFGGGQLSVDAQQANNAALGAAGNLFQQGQGMGMDAISQMLQQQAGAAGQLGQQSLAGGQALGGLFGDQQGRMLQAMMGMGQMGQQQAMLPAQMAQMLFGMQAQGVDQNNQVAMNQYNDFVRQQSLLPMAMQFFANQQQQMAGPSTLSQLANMGIGVGSVMNSK